MKTHSYLFRLTVLALALMGAALLPSNTAMAHCDSMDGPVVKDAQRALAEKNLTPVLKWVRAGDEAAVRTAFEATLQAKSQRHIVGAREWREGGSDASRSKTYKDKRVITTGGRELGAVRDVYVHEQTGVVEAYDVAGPAFTKLIERRSVLSQSADVTVGPDALIVSEDAAREFENHRERAELGETPLEPRWRGAQGIQPAHARTIDSNHPLQPQGSGPSLDRGRPPRSILVFYGLSHWPVNCGFHLNGLP